MHPRKRAEWRQNDKREFENSGLKIDAGPAEESPYKRQNDNEDANKRSYFH